MNESNLETLREEMSRLGFGEALVAQMEEKMKANVPEFQLYNSVDATKGRVDRKLYFKQSSKSDYYYLNKFEVCHEKGQPLAEGDHLMVATKMEGADQGKIEHFEQLSDALVYFKGQKEGLQGQEYVSNLLVGTSPDDCDKLATLANGKTTFVHEDFGMSYRTAPITHTVYVEKGKGFTAEHAANLIQGRAVYRDDLVSQAGHEYKAWIKLDFDVPKDKFGNFMVNQYTDPAYGFDLEKVLDKFEFKELADPDQRKQLEEQIRNGNTPLVTVEKEGKEVKLHIEAVPRYSQVNLSTQEGKMEKREQFLKAVPKVEQGQKQAPAKEKGQGRSRGQGVAV